QAGVPVWVRRADPEQRVNVLLLRHRYARVRERRGRKGVSKNILIREGEGPTRLLAGCLPSVGRDRVALGTVADALALVGELRAVLPGERLPSALLAQLGVG